jgi:hypothetical protein
MRSNCFGLGPNLLLAVTCDASEGEWPKALAIPMRRASCLVLRMSDIERAPRRLGANA